MNPTIPPCILVAWVVEPVRLQGDIGFCITAVQPRWLFPHDDHLRAVMPRLIRDIFGNPFRPVSFDPQWRTSTALSLAHGIYDDRAFDRLPILADALQDAGAEGDILDHLRGPGPHVLGCWALDAVLSRE